ncbi:uncharacterized protein PADG_04582 [Paracoccidioides brasiliensis Pb18]|uniref:FAD-binding PCMH-type domain-containing protein n=1 Tax=Paracoccidioides brasiliensis (strain Pb18) TaxID=502780 RepID=C1GC60_PARBD|nr:uncharacterized protein PADG_04582 [Paracoccidioides brasiliensis Pb18]EEH48503.1 hypothetical protein PADG_04582 [Paracoccidioides brasiliensis Pb18]
MWLSYNLALVSILLGRLVVAFELLDIDSASPLAYQETSFQKLPIVPKFSRNDTVPRRCVFACTYLSKVYPGTVAFPGNRTYSEFQESFWSQQQSKFQPTCIFRPQITKQVSFATFVNTEVNCTFAVRSGGYSAFPGAANIQDGMTLDLRSINEITISPDKKTAVLGTGNTWYDVYKKLEVQNLTAVGGSTAGEGVGGQILGGGISSLSNLYGWACDNVRNYEIVGAHGGILNIDAKQPGMFFALRGGGNNFAIVTRFTVNVYPQKQMWHGLHVFDMDKTQDVLAAYVNIARNSTKDPPSSNSFTTFSVTNDSETISIGLENADGIPYPPIFDEMKTIPSLFESSLVQYMSEISKRLANETPSGLRNTHWTYTFRLDFELAEFVVDTFLATTQSLKYIRNIKADCIFQTITESMLSLMKGNTFGLPAEGGPYAVLLLSASWSNEIDDMTIYQAFSIMLETIREEAKESGLHVDYLFMNYASQFQDVISSYGPEIVQRLREASLYDDPEQILQKLQPGYFKMNGSAPAELRNDSA